MPAAQLDYSSRERWFVAISAMFGFGLDFYNLIVIAFLFTVIQSSLSARPASSSPPPSPPRWSAACRSAGSATGSAARTR
jgi:hypothetical protein